MVTQRYGYRVSRVVMLWYFLIEAQGALNHIPHLLLAGCAAARYSLLHGARCIFYSSKSVYHCSSHRYALGAAQFQHALHILPKERRLDGHAYRFVLLNEALHSIEDEVQAFRVVRGAVELEYAHLYERGTYP